MNKSFMELSFPFVMGLFNLKRAAEERGDVTALNSLAIQYPEIFTDDFQEFVESVKSIAEYLGEKYGTEFSPIGGLSYSISSNKLN